MSRKQMRSVVHGHKYYMGVQHSYQSVHNIRMVHFLYRSTDKTIEEWKNKMSNKNIKSIVDMITTVISMHHL